MDTRRVLSLMGCFVLALLQTACGGDHGFATAPVDTGQAAEFGRSKAGGAPAAVPSMLAAGGAAPIVLTPMPSSEPPAGPPRLNPNGIPAGHIEASLARYRNAAEDEASCWTKDNPCDRNHAVKLNRKSNGLVGWWTQKDRDVFVDAEDLLVLPAVSGAVTVFVKNNPDSKDWLDATLEDRNGTKLHTFAPLAVGASAAISWTRTDDQAAGLYRLRLRARTGSGDHMVNYTVLPIVHAHWLAQVQGQPSRVQ